MVWIDKIEELQKFNSGKKLSIPILSDHKKHWSENRISFIYLYNLETFEEVVLGFNHNDVSPCKILRLSNFITEDDYCYKAKYLSGLNVNLKEIESGEIYEAELVVWFNSNKPLKVEEGNIIRSYWNQFQDIENVNDSIPIMKWLEYCRDVKDEFLIHFKDFEVTEGFLKYNQFLIDLAEIEKNGLFTN
jgi:hypothetical protein